MVGLVASVTIRVGSVTSTSFRSSLGDMRNLSGPMLPLSSGTLPGQISTTSGLSAPTTGQATHINMTTETVGANRIRKREFALWRLVHWTARRYTLSNTASNWQAS